MAALDASAPGPALVVLLAPLAHPARPMSTAAADSVARTRNLFIAFIATTAYCGWL
jgi:hypothetical protein